MAGVGRSYATSGARLLGSTSLRFALHGWQRKCEYRLLGGDGKLCGTVALCRSSVYGKSWPNSVLQRALKRPMRASTEQQPHPKAVVQGLQHNQLYLTDSHPVLFNTVPVRLKLGRLIWVKIRCGDGREKYPRKIRDDH